MNKTTEFLLTIILIIDLVTFAITFIMLLVFIKVPELKHDTDKNQESYLKSCLEGVRFLQKNLSFLGMSFFLPPLILL